MYDLGAPDTIEAPPADKTTEIKDLAELAPGPRSGGSGAWATPLIARGR